ILQAEVKPISEPDIDAEPPEPGSAFRYTARIEVKPEIELPDLAALEGRKPDLAVPPPFAIAHHLIRLWAEEEE
ncbi:MAG: trigger factor family protein, partial [Caulobacterales bacterium]|nr:trigger factor family protein [Caulobacterales bacterium]